MSAVTVEMTAHDLRKLLTPALPFTSEGSYGNALDCVRIESSGDHLVATATDRYRIVMNRVRLETPPPAGFSTLLRAGNAKQLLSWAKPKRGATPPTVGLTLTPERLEARLSVDGYFPATLLEAWPRVTEDFPPITRLVAGWLDAPQGAGAPVSVKPEFAASIFKAVSRATVEPVTYWGEGPTKPVVFVAGDFLAVLMPVRYDSDADRVAEARETWGSYLTPPEPVPAKPKRTRRTKAVAK